MVRLDRDVQRGRVCLRQRCCVSAVTRAEVNMHLSRVGEVLDEVLVDAFERAAVHEVHGGNPSGESSRER